MKILGIQIPGTEKELAPKPELPIESTPKSQIIPKLPRGGRVSIPEHDNATLRKWMAQENYATAPFVREAIPVIRNLYRTNSEVGMALTDLVQLSNTGHTIEFSKDVPVEEQRKMREHLNVVTKFWHEGTQGINGLINKLFAQIYVGGALSAELSVRPDKTGLHRVIFVNPEGIYWRYRPSLQVYEPYQKVTDSLLHGTPTGVKYKKLNPFTYKYYGIMNDEDTPYGIPPMLTALESVFDVKMMKKNIRNITKLMGILGFLEVQMAKPDMKANETDEQYEARLNQVLTEAKTNISDGYYDGVVVGYEEDHTYEFHTAAKSAQGVAELYNLIKIELANGLKHAHPYFGLDTGKSESHISVIFTKTLSQLRNTQSMVGEFIEYAYKLELLLAGFKNGSKLEVNFKPSTITDDLKIQQANEIKIRNHRTMYADGLIDLDDYARAMGLDKPDQKEPRVEIRPDGSKERDRQEKEKKDDDNDRKNRGKKKPVPKRKDTDTRPR